MILQMEPTQKKYSLIVYCDLVQNASRTTVIFSYYYAFPIDV